METRKRLLSWLIKQGYTEAQALARLKGLTPPFHQTASYASNLRKKALEEKYGGKYRWMDYQCLLEDYPLLANLYELREQGKIKQERILPDWVKKNVERILKMAKDQDPDAPDWAKLVWSVYWFAKFSGYEVVALAVAKIRAKWHTGDRPEAFFKKLKEQEERAIRVFVRAGYPEEELMDEHSELRENARLVGCFDDRDTSLDSDNEREGYGLPKEDFDNDRKQLAFLLGGSTAQRNLTWIGLTIPFIWPKDSNSFTEVPLANPRVSTTAEGVTITLTSAFVTEDWVKSPLLWEQIKVANKARFGFYEQIPSTWEMIAYLQSHQDINESPAKKAQRYDEEVRSGKVRVEDIVGMETAHRQKRHRAREHPLFRM